jgi:butyrate kinase
MRLIREGIYSPGELVKAVSSKGGLFSYVGEDDLEKIIRRIDRGDEEAKLAFEGMAYQTAREIGALAVVLKGKVDGIILTGGGAKSDRLTALIEERVGFLGRIFIVPGELELKALAEGAGRVLSGEEEVKIYC